MNSTEEEGRLQEVLRKIDASKRTPLKKMTISTIAKLIFYSGVEQKEISNMKVGDVLQGDSIRDEITPTPGKGSTQLSGELKQALNDYLQGLKPTPNISLPPESPLFPGYEGENGVRKLRRHFEPFLGSLTFDDLRRAGANHFYKTLIGNGVDQLEAAKQTARQFRLKDKAVGHILKGTKEPAGKKRWERMPSWERIYYLWEELERSLDWHDVIINNRVPKLVEEFFKAIDDDSRLNKWSQADGTTTKDIFLNEIIKKFRLGMTGIEKKEEELIANFEDSDNTHTPEQKLEFKKRKLLEYIERLRATPSKKERKRIVKERKGAEEKGEREKEREEKSREKKENFWMFDPRKKSRLPTGHSEMTARGLKRKKNVIYIPAFFGEDRYRGQHRYYYRAVQLAEKHINDAGGINGRELSVTTDMPLSEAIIGGVPALGPTRSTDVMDVSDATKVFPIPIAIGGTNVDLLQGNPGLFRCRPDDSLVANAIVNYIKGDMKLTRLGILYDSDIFGTGGAHLVEQGCNNNELTIVRKETYTAGDKNYLAKLDSLRGAGIEVMVVYGTDPEDVAEIQKKYRSLGSPPPYEYIGSPSSGMRACLDLSGNDAEDLIVIADYVP
ncbi:MAG: ABC transporter substrate-binding protein, partial [Thermodesulfobacteriota bacterium]